MRGLYTHIVTHDLLRIDDTDQLRADGPIPDWVENSLAFASFVVVRRVRSSNGLVPVGVRGRARSQRFAAFVSRNSIRERITPAEIAEKRGWKCNRLSGTSFAMALDYIEATLATSTHTWGPIGSVGFELASGASTVGFNSDLDLLIRMENFLDSKSARQLSLRLAEVPVRVDVQLETPSGAIALAEYARCEASVMLRTCDGPRLVSNPCRS